MNKKYREKEAFYTYLYHRSAEEGAENIFYGFVEKEIKKFRR